MQFAMTTGLTKLSDKCVFPSVIPAKAGIQRLYRTSWIPAFAGTTG